ncbi:MFS transporter [Streptomyces sp. NBC_00513]|uniref:MFS transporter n=1 Tax=unclassified Streptomyces TaxID=2593676 RepID=UPI00224D014D|nr:MFS transporter [Streptomyces sp. NBC_00424]MCX5071251.1 MFS transporter [Streptomyces sp. NBC_00424]WUD45333.1 MFS transporter [Streptomyces sp. NBC_00513]
MTGAADSGAAGGVPGRRRILAPLALAQFICSFAGSNMNVMINDISEDLDTTVQGVQVAITIFLLVMAALMIPGGKLTDKWGRKRCLMAGLVVYGLGAMLSAVAPHLGVLIIGNSILEGVGTALLIPPVYILTTLLFTGTAARARAFGVIMAMGGIGAAAGPLIGGLITTAISWRAAFVFQALVVVVILVLCRGIDDPLPPDPGRPFDTVGAVLSAAGLVLLVTGILAVDDSGALALGLLLAGALVLAGFFAWVRGRERAGREALLSTALFRDRTSNLGLITQNTQWLMLMGVSFTVAAYLQVVRGYDAIQTGVIFTAATLGILASSLAAEKLARRRAQRTLIMAGFAMTITGVGVLLALVAGTPSPWAFAPGLLLIGLGLGVMLTPSVNMVQSRFPESLQGEISGLSRSVSNLGSSLGTAVAGTILVSGLSTGAYATAMAALAVVGVGGLAAAALLPRAHPKATPEPDTGSPDTP